MGDTRGVVHLPGLDYLPLHLRSLGVRRRRLRLHPLVRVLCWVGVALEVGWPRWMWARKVQRLVWRVIVVVQQLPWHQEELVEVRFQSTP